VRVGEGRGRVDLQAKAWPQNYFPGAGAVESALDFLLGLIELRNIKQEHKNMYELQTKYQY